MRTLTISTIIICVILTTGVGLYAEIINIPDDFETIQEGLDESEDGDTVLVHPGTYLGPFEILSQSIVLASLMLTTGDPAYIDSTILDGDANGRSVVVIRGRDTEPVVMGFTIQNGDTDYGGGIYVRDSNPTLQHIVIKENSAQVVGGGIYITESQWGLVSECVVINNTANYGGGCGFRATDEIVVVNSHIANNIAEYHGGGFRVGTSTQLIIENSTIEGNQTQDFGGGIVLRFNSRLTMRSCIVRENVGTPGSGVFLDESDAEIHYSLFAGNSGDEGTVQVRYGEELFINNSTIVDNHSAGVYIDSVQSRMINSIISGNDGYQIYAGFPLSVSYSLVRGGEDDVRGEIEWGDGNIDEDPMFADPNAGDYRLSRVSPCIDAGDPESPSDADSSPADMGAFPFLQSGLLTGYVYDSVTGDALANAQLIAPDNYSVRTGDEGYFEMTRLSYYFTLTASHPGYADSTTDSLHIDFDDTLGTEFHLKRPIPSVVPEEIIRSLDPDSRIDIEVSIENDGNYPLEWISRATVPDDTTLEWGLVRSFPVGEIIENDRVQGVAYVDDQFYISAGERRAPLIYILHRFGIWFDSFPQPGEGRSGMYDLAWDGEYLWGSRERIVYQFDTQGEVIRSWVGPNRYNRALAWDSDRNLLWISAIVGESIYGYNVAGELEVELEHYDTYIQSLAYFPDDPDGFPLYVFYSIPDVEKTFVSKIDPDTGDTLFVYEIDADDDYSVLGAFITNEYIPFQWNCLGIISNADGDLLNVYNLKTDVFWLSLNPESGIIDPDQSEDIILMFSTADLDRGQYEAEVLFEFPEVRTDLRLPVILRVGLDSAPVSADALPTEFGISSVYPNPFNSTTIITYSLPVAALVSLQLYDLSGREVRTLVEGRKQAGVHQTMLNASDLPSGLYFIRLQTAGQAFTRKVMIIR